MRVDQGTRSELRKPSRLSPVRIIGKIAGYVILAVVLLFALVTVVFPKVLGATTYTVLSGSMRPGLEPGHLIGVKPAPAGELRIGDVITFQLRSGEPTMVPHRIVGKSVSSDGQASFTTRGDDNNVDDPDPVQEIQIQGKLVYSIPYVGRVTNLMTPPVKAVVTTVLGVAIIGYGLSRFISIPERKRSGTRALSTVAIVGTALGLCFGSGVEPAQATANSPGIEVSPDGVQWQETTSGGLFSEVGKIVPGQVINSELWVRNTSDFPMEITVTGEFFTASESPGDSALSSELDLQFGQTSSNTWVTERLDPNEVSTTTLRTTFNASAQEGRNSAANLSFVVEAQQLDHNPEQPQQEQGSEQGLAQTGFQDGHALIWVGLLAVVGLALVLPRARRK